ncbi:Hypothetical protein EAG7_03036 [Klebsiella aerogenes]|nr:Hypothetical protein EAG7_03036 [Klebsiella aerogenes]CCG31583.1 hypothetical protein [Klebsiella aerogenes EA1509E]
MHIAFFMYGRLNIQMKVIYTVTAGKLQNGDGKKQGEQE